MWLPWQRYICQSKYGCFCLSPKVTYLHTKIEGGLKIFISNFASLSWRIALNDLSPEYISELLNNAKYTRNLRSQSQHLLSVPKSRTVTYGNRAFAVCAPKLWNELPFQLRMSSNIRAFKSGLKTMLFKMAYL